MAISTLGTTSRTIIQMTASNAGIHSFSVGNLSGFLYVRATDAITVILGRSSASAGTIAGQSGTTFQVGADNFDTILIYATNVGTEVVVDFIPVTASTAVSAPSWLSLAGYSFGNGTISSLYTAAPTKILFPVDTVSVSNAIPSGRAYGSGAANSGVAGYLFGGYTVAAGTAVNSIDQYTFPNDTASTLVATLSGTKYYGTAYADSGVAAYVTNGYLAGVVSDTVIQKFAFPSMTRTTANATALARIKTFATANGHTAGYIGAGASGAGASLQATDVRKHFFSTDVAITTTASITTAENGTVCHMAAATHHGNMMVYSGSNRNSDDALTPTYKVTYLKYWKYATDTQSVSTLRFQKPINLTYGGYAAGATAFANSGIASYHSGGTDGENYNLQTIEKVGLPDSTASVVFLLTGTIAGAGHIYNSQQSFVNMGIY